MKNRKDRALFAYAQQIGKSLFLPIAILPFAGILLGIGSSFTNPTTIATYHLEALLHPGTVPYAFMWNGEELSMSLDMTSLRCNFLSVLQDSSRVYPTPSAAEDAHALSSGKNYNETMERLFPLKEKSESHVLYYGLAGIQDFGTGWRVYAALMAEKLSLQPIAAYQILNPLNLPSPDFSL